MRKIFSWARTSSGPTTLAAALALFLLSPMIGLAQSDNAQLSGFVRDPAGAVTPNVKVVIKSEEREFERTTTTNEEGYYVISNVSPGFYTVSAEATGFKRFEVTNKKVDPGIAATVDIALQTGEVSETVSVIAETAAIQTETATVGKLVEAKQIQYMQLNGRNPLFLALLKPGVSGGALGGFSFGLTSGGFNINGSRSQDNLITFDGAVAVRTRSNGTSIGVADVDATQEVQILSANYNAEYGRSSGGQIRIVTKSGTRDFHGTAYEFVRNSAFDANSWSRKRTNPGNQPCDDEQFKRAIHCRPDPFRYNQFGYSLNGPVILPFTKFNRERDKLFWLFGQEWVRQRRASTTQITVPSLAMRQGDFSELLSPTNRFYGAARYIKDPLKTGTCSATDQSACFSYQGRLNVIDPARLSSNGLGFLNALPEPTVGFIGPGSSNFFQERPTLTDQRKDTLSIDYYPSDKHQIRGRLQNYNFLDVSAFRNGTDRAPQIIDRPNQTVSIGWTWTISPTWINEALIAGSRDQVFISVDTEGERYRRSIYGINYDYIFDAPKEIQDKIPTVEIQNFAALDGGPYPASSTGPIYQFSDNVTNIRGNHTIKFGGYFERAGQNDFDQINVAGTPGGTNNQNGRFVFSNATRLDGTGTAIANAALGLFDTYAEIGQRSFTPYRGHMFEWFAQDSWKATPNLRLEFGLRHSIIQPYYSLWRNMSVFDPGSYDPALGATITQNPANGFITGGSLQARYNGLVIPGDGFTDAASGRIPIADSGQFDFLFRGFDKQYSKIHWNNFQPRVGMAYAFNDRTVLRAGAGRFFTRLGVSDSVFLGGNPPFQPTASVSFGQADNPGGIGGNVFPLVITTQDPIFKNPEAWTWNATFEREIGFDTSIEVGYVGRRGLHAQRERNINQLQLGTRFLPANDGVNPDALRPYRGYGIIRSTNNDANSIYNSLQLGLTRRFTQGFSFGVAYTLSKSMDSGSEQRDVIPNAYDASNLWAPSNFDRRHVAVINAIYEFPFFRDRSTLKGKVLGGWTISAVSQFQTGTPFSVATGDDFAGLGTGSGSQFWFVNGDPSIDQGDRAFSENNNDPNFWFNRAAFSRPANNTYNNERVRNLLYHPGFQNHNLGLFKDFSFNENHRITLRFEAFNWLNHPNWSSAVTSPTDAAFGRVVAKSSERNLQFALRYSF